MKHLSKRFISIMIITTIILSLLVGCGEDVQEEEEEVQENYNTIVDMGGREVEIPEKIETVFATDPRGTIFLYTLTPEKMVGWNYDLRDGEKRFILEQYHDLPNLGGAGSQVINVEEILKVNPDILIHMEAVDENSIEEAEELTKQFEKPVILVDDNINNLDEIYELLGGVLGVEEKAEVLAKYSGETLRDVEEKSAQITDDMKVDVYYAEGPAGLETEPAGAWHSEVLDMVGGNNIAETDISGDKGKSEVSIEQILYWDPDLILSWDDERGGYYSEIFKDPSWKDIKAVKNGEVYEIPNKPFNWFDRPPSVNRILGLKWVGNLLYPDIYDYDMRDEVKEFYQEFYHYELTEEEIDELLENSTRQ